jgi:integrase
MTMIMTSERFESVMASIHKDPRNKSPYYYAAFYAADGRRKFKSTKTRSRAAALRCAIEWESAAKRAREGKLYAAQARRVLDEILSAATGENLAEFSVSSWFKQFMASKAGGASPATLARYKQVLADFETWLGARARLPLAAITPGDLVEYRDKLRTEGRAISTCNQTIKKILAIPFESARKLGYIATNPAAGVDVLKDRKETKASGREPFTEKEIAKLAAAASPDWQGMIILAATTGLRLGDAARLTWGNIDIEQSKIELETQKTGAELSLPIHPDFAGWLEEQTRGIKAAPVFPTLSGLGVGSRGGLSDQFRRLMDRAEISCRVVSRKGAGRKTFSKGFHSLRHSFVSRLANLGVAEEIRQKLAGHSDAKTHAGYTHLEIESLQAAVAKLPKIAR